MGMTRYPIAPTTILGGIANPLNTGFQPRPIVTLSLYSVADALHPLTGDCSNCHAGTNAFTGQAKPNGHIPTAAACTVCHVVGSDFSVAGLTTNFTTLHTGITSGCIACHTAGTGAGPFAGCATQAACSSPPPLTYQPKVMALAAGGSPTAPSAATHVPAAGIACEKCHALVFTSFSGMQMKGNTPAHTAVAAYTCITCHEGTPKYVWYGVTIRTEPVGHEGRKAGQDCAGSGCHSKTKFSSFMELRVRLMVRAAIGSVGGRPRILPDGTVL